MKITFSTTATATVTEHWQIDVDVSELVHRTARELVEEHLATGVADQAATDDVDDERDRMLLDDSIEIES